MDDPKQEGNLMKIELADAGRLIESQVNQNDYAREVDRLSKLAPAALKAELLKLENDIPLLAQEGKLDKMGLTLKLLKNFNLEPNTRIFVHYFTQSQPQQSKDSQSPSFLQNLMNKFTKTFNPPVPGEENKK